MKRALLILLTFCIHFISQAQQTINGSITHDNITRSYILYIPLGYTGASSIPLLLNFHGFTNTAQDQLDWSDFRPIADTAQFIVVHPQGLLFNGNTHWNVGGWTLGSTANDIGFTLALIDSLSSQYNIDSSRIYSTGFSNGGFFSFELACQVGEKIAAIASVGGSMTPQTFNNCNPDHFTPVLQFHGTSDNTVPYTGAGFSRPINTILDYWVGFNGADTPASVISLPDLDSADGSTVDHIIYSNVTNGAEIEHFRLNGDGHNWPGYTGNMDINASEEIWKFLSRYTLDSLAKPLPSFLDAKRQNKLMAYPNPSNGIVNLHFGPGPSPDQVELISTQGEVFILEPGASGKINVSGFSKGIYLLKCQLAQQVYITRISIR